MCLLNAVKVHQDLDEDNHAKGQRTMQLVYSSWSRQTFVCADCAYPSLLLKIGIKMLIRYVSCREHSFHTLIVYGPTMFMHSMQFVSVASTCCIPACRPLLDAISFVTFGTRHTISNLDALRNLVKFVRCLCTLNQHQSVSVYLCCTFCDLFLLPNRE